MKPNKIGKAGDWVVTIEGAKHEFYTFNGFEWVYVDKAYLELHWLRALMEEYAAMFGLHTPDECEEYAGGKEPQRDESRD